MATRAFTIILETWRALLQPRRALAIAAVGGALLAAQIRYEPRLAAVWPAIGIFVSFVLCAPSAYRALVLERPERRWQFLLYLTLCAVLTFLFGDLVPKAMRLHGTFLTSGPSLTVCFALFVVGGWGLGRDIHLEESLRRTQARAEALAKEAEQAQLLALRSHLDPHFLFNTLNAIAEWCREDGEVAESAVLRLASMLRTVLSGVRASTWPLAKELELLDMLFELHLLRDPNLFELRRQLPSPLPEAEVPPLVLLPLAENAVKHGPAAGHRGVLVLKVSTEGERLHVMLENPGPYRGPRPGSDGLPTVERRLALAYEGRAKLRIEGVGNRTRVELELPLRPPVNSRAA
jgi:sensor histidine kinase YesM